MDEFDTCTKENPTLNNQKDVILCDLMMELKERKCILFLSYMYFLALFLSYVNWSFVEENETMSKINVLLCMHQSCNHEFDKGLELKTGQVCT